MSDLLSTLNYRPEPLRFGTSGRRGRVRDLTQLEIYINVLAELEYLQTLAPEAGGAAREDEVYFAHDLRPSSTALSEEFGGRGELCQAVVRAIADAGMRPVNLGPLPTPALALRGLARHRASIMVTGSHIPFDLNGYKLNTSVGELLKEHEDPINQAVERVRTRICGRDAAESLFDANGMFKAGSLELPKVDGSAREEYLARYVGFFGAGCPPDWSQGVGGSQAPMGYREQDIGRADGT